MDLARAFSERLPDLTASSTAPDRLAYARDLWPRHLVEIDGGTLPGGPALVAWPKTAAEVVRILEFARAEGCAVVPFGAGSGVCGAVLPDSRSLIMDLKALRDFSVDAHAPFVEAGAGLLGITLEDELATLGYTTGHFPSSILCSTLGGWVAARGAGQCSGRYGKIEDMLLGLECVLGSGEIVHLERRRSQPNLLPLMAGSEGTLAVITRVRLRLHAAPNERSFDAWTFPDIERGFDALRTLFQKGLRPAVARLYDPLDSLLLARGSARSRSSAPQASTPRPWLASFAQHALASPRALERAIRSFEGNLLGGSTLVLVFEGAAGLPAAERERARLLCERAGGRALGEAPARAWLAHRYSVSFRQSTAFRLGLFTDTMEVAAPWSAIAGVYRAVRGALSRHALVMAHLSHAYPDGCSIYFTFAGRGHGREAALRYDAAWRDALGAAHDSGATLSHHHGIGRSKADWLAAELGFGYELLGRLRYALDPLGRLNPGALAAGASGGHADLAEPASALSALEVDAPSQLADFDAALSLGSARALLERHGLALDVDATLDCSGSLRDWAARGFPGWRDAFDDPVGGLLAGFSARLSGGERLRIRAAPRRATGPDLSALFVGAHGRVGRFERLTLCVERRGAPRPSALPFQGARDPALSDSERELFLRIARQLSSA